MVDRLAEDTQTLYAELLALLLALEGGRGWAHLSGSFTTKRIKGAEYVYFQYSDPGGTKRQFSIGRKDEALAETMAAYAQGRTDHEQDLAQVSRLTDLLRSAGLDRIHNAPARVIRGLAEAGVFAMGGVLVGSHAFQTLGHVLGVRWERAAWRTQDVDIASHPLRVAVPRLEADVPAALDSLRMGFVPVPQLDSRQSSTSFRVRGRPLRVDLITPGSEEQQTPIFVPRLKAAAAPIKYLSLVLRDAQPAAVVNGTATLVVVPDPARFALHKLLVSRTRSLPQQTKGEKDLHQAALLLEVLTEDRPDDLRRAASAFAESGRAVTSKLVRGLDAAVGRWPEAEAGASLVRPLLVV